MSKPLQLRLRLRKAGVFERPAFFARLREILPGFVFLPEPRVGDAKQVQAVGGAPCILAIRLPRPLEHPLRRLDGRPRVPDGQMNLRQLDPDVQRPPAESARIRELDAVLRSGKGERKVSLVPREL